MTFKVLVIVDFPTRFEEKQKYIIFQNFILVCIETNVATKINANNFIFAEYKENDDGDVEDINHIQSFNDLYSALNYTEILGLKFY